MHTDSPDSLDRQTQLIRALSAALRGAGAGPVDLFETHISWVLVAGNDAFKIKKAVRFDFLDFSTLDIRRHFCEEELRLNRRLAPELYLGVIPVGGGFDSPRLLSNPLPHLSAALSSNLSPNLSSNLSPDLSSNSAGAGPAIEYMLHMRAFAQESVWSERLAGGLIVPDEADQLADRLARFHREAQVAPADKPWGTSGQLLACADEILEPLGVLLAATEYAPQISALQRWHRKRHRELSLEFERRKQEGYVREGHGDLHCANILTLHGQATAFDCIEFSEGLRWIDVLNDLAFAVMDLHVRGRPDLAARLLNRYLEISGDYSGLGVLRYYLALRALVRCKIHLLRMQELPANAQERGRCEQDMRAYLAYAGACTQPRKVALMITHGFSGSGKSTIAGRVAERCDAIRLRSDVERKRLHDMHPADHVPAAAGQLYASASSHATYARLAELARGAIEAGWPAVIDAAFLDSAQRRSFAALARELNVPFLIVDVHASEALMRERLAARASSGSDPSDADAAVLAHQLATHHPLTAEEMQHAVIIDNMHDKADVTVEAVLDATLARLGL